MSATVCGVDAWTREIKASPLRETDIAEDHRRCCTVLCRQKARGDNTVAAASESRDRKRRLRLPGGVRDRESCREFFDDRQFPEHAVAHAIAAETDQANFRLALRHLIVSCRRIFAS